MRRLVLALATFAAVATVMSSGSFAVFSETKANSATWQAQSTFPPLNTAVPAVSSSTVLSITTLTGSVGSWAVTNAPTTTWTLQWQRCSAGTCTDVGAPSVVSSLLGTLDHVVSGADAGSTLRLKVTGADSSIPGSDRSSTVAYSAEVPA